MATFQSGHRRVGGGTATARSRRVFEGNEERPSAGTAGRYRPTGDRSEKSDSARISNLNISDETKTENEETPIDIENTTEEEKSSKTQKKDRGGASANSARKRRDRKNLREKRRSTGVVIMPDQPTVAADDEEKLVQENTVRNMDGPVGGQSTSSTDNEDVKKQLEAYEIAIEEWKDELAKAKKEIESLQKDNQRLKDENSALLRVVGSLSGPRN